MKILLDLRLTVLASVGLVVLLTLVVYALYPPSGGTFILFFIRWLHVLSGVMWIGLLWYFNFVQIPTMPKIEDSLKPAISKFIAPAALFWFRWSAVATVVTGILLAYGNGYLLDALTLGFLGGFSTIIGIGMWLGLSMAFNVWVVIWPNQKIALGLVEADASAKPAAARRAMIFSRINTLLSLPMLYAMVAAQNV